jgi:molybdopterin molybdotransferase
VRSVDQHLAAVLSVVAPLAELELTLPDAHGCVLAEDVVAVVPLPSFDAAAFDGYAVRIADVAAASPTNPVTLPVVGDVAPGSTGAYSVQNGFSVRMTAGAPVPQGAEAIVPLPWTDGGLAHVAIHHPSAAGHGIKHAGDDVAAGQQVVAAGTRIGAQHVAVLAAVGRARVRARPRPRVVIVSIGGQYVDLGSATQPGQLPDANTPSIAAAVTEAGAIAFRVGVVGDDAQTITSVLEDQLIRADAVIACGGGLGAYSGDSRGALGEALRRLGTVDIDNVAMRPGAMQGFGTIGPDATPIFTLPGDPVAAYISFEVFVRPAIRRMLGTDPIHRPVVRAVATTAIPGVTGMRSYVAARLDVDNGIYVVTPADEVGRERVSALSTANALAVVEENLSEIPKDAAATVVVLERRQG